MRDEKIRGTGGSTQADWTDANSSLPVSEWANEIIGEGLAYSPFATIVQSGGQMRRANKKQHFLVSSVTTLTTLWTTGVTDVRSASYESPLDYTTLDIDPVESRTMMPVAYETMDEIDMIPLEADIRKQLAHLGEAKVTHTLYTAMDGTALDSAYDWQVGGDSLTVCDSNTAIDWGSALSVDNVKEGVEALIGVFYPPTDMIVPPALWIDLFNESQFVNAAQYGSQNTAIIEGQIPRFMGVDFHLDTHMPDDSSDKDVALMLNKNYYMGTVVSKDPQIKVGDRMNTGEWEFFMNLKLGAKVLQEYAGIAFYS